MATVKWLPEALDDLKRHHAFIEPHSPDAARRDTTSRRRSLNQSTSTAVLKRPKLMRRELCARASEKAI